MELRFSGGDVAYDYTADEDDVSQAPVTYLEDQRFNPADALEKQNANEYSEATLSQALGKLDQRSRDILKQRWLQDGKKSTLHDLAAQYNISAERVRQLEEAAFNKLRQEIDN
jgi:RNA polymerase sigma-32 factor